MNKTGCVSLTCASLFLWVLMTCFQMSERVKLQPPFFQFRSRLKAAELNRAHKRLQLTECVCVCVSRQTRGRSVTMNSWRLGHYLPQDASTDTDITVDARAWFLHDDVIH